MVKAPWKSRTRTATYTRRSGNRSSGAGSPTCATPVARGRPSRMRVRSTPLHTGCRDHTTQWSDAGTARSPAGGRLLEGRRAGVGGPPMPVPARTDCLLSPSARARRESPPSSYPPVVAHALARSIRPQLDLFGDRQNSKTAASKSPSEWRQAEKAKAAVRARPRWEPRSARSRTESADRKEVACRSGSVRSRTMRAVPPILYRRYPA
jgi:hypothetical protein